MVSVAVAFGPSEEPTDGAPRLSMTVRSLSAAAVFTVVTVKDWLLLPAGKVRVPVFVA